MASAAIHNRDAMRRYMRLITLGGALAMVFVTCTMSPVTTDFLKELGATEFHFGLLSGIPLLMVALQFVGAYISGQLHRRKSWFIVMLVSGRFLYLPAAYLPLLFPELDANATIYLFIACVAACTGLAHFATPLWLSWMGDLIPARILNRYWAERHRVLQGVWTLSFLGVAAFSYYSSAMSAQVMFRILATIGAITGIVDIILFVWVHEPQNMQTGNRRMLDLLTEPLRHKEYRTLVVFNCLFSAAAMFAAAFMQIYVLKILGVPRWQTILIWSAVGLGSAFIARTWGRLADRHGHRPILVTCVAGKPLAALVFLLITPRMAFPVLTAFFLFDSMLNAGYFIGVNGYKLKMAPRENRSMFIAATMALAGMAGGLSAIAAGALLRVTSGMAIEFAGRTWINYHLIFLISFIMRVACIPVAIAIREPNSSSSAVVLAHLRGLWPLRTLMLPFALYRSNQERKQTPDQQPGH